MKYLCKRNYAKSDISQELIFCVRKGVYYECVTLMTYFTGLTTIHYMNIYGELGNMRRYQLDDFYTLFYTKKEERKIKLEKLNESNL